MVGWNHQLLNLKVDGTGARVGVSSSASDGTAAAAGSCGQVHTPSSVTKRGQVGSPIPRSQSQHSLPTMDCGQYR